MKKYNIAYGLGGGFNSLSWDDEVYEFENEDEALEFAFDKACEEYENYAGSYGLRSVNQIMEEDGLDEEDAENIYYDERDSWLDYKVKEIH